MKMTMDSFLKQIDEEVRILPDQAPIEHFVHHNNLHHFEDMKFEDAVESAFLKYGKNPYMDLEYYRNRLSEGEIDPEIFKEILAENGFPIAEDSLFDFILYLKCSIEDHTEIPFYKSERLMLSKDRKSLVKMSKEALDTWENIKEIKINPSKTRIDFNVNKSLNKVNKLLVPFFSALLDQGQSNKSFTESESFNAYESLLKYLKVQLSSSQFITVKELLPNQDEKISTLYKLFFEHLNEEESRKRIQYHFNTLPGWAGMIYKLSHNKEVIPRKDLKFDIYDYLLIKLIMYRVLEVHEETMKVEIFNEALVKEDVFHYLSYFNPKADINKTIELFEKLSPIELKRFFQQSYEKTYQEKILSALVHKPTSSCEKTKYQMFFCIDDREESLRRYLEEVSPLVETYGVAGFFGLDMMYQKAHEKRHRRLCPPAATPKYLVKEHGKNFSFSGAKTVHFSHSGFFRSTLMNLFLSPVHTMDFHLRLYSPKTRHDFKKKIKLSKVEKVATEAIGQEFYKDLKLGYSKEELADRVAAILRGAGLVKNFSDYIIMIGHGHDSVNNPHVAAYRCGACSGSNAYPNAKIFAKAANDQVVREFLKDKYNITIPKTSYFIGGYHDTCNDKLEIYDLDQKKMPKFDQEEIHSIMIKASRLNAKERCAKFYQAPKDLSPEKALSFVEKRALNIAEPRPELNHATNALTIVGRRDLTKDLFLDRKAFLVSYDPSIDTDGSILLGLLSAVVPVCAGINLEYYFSKVDTENYGAGCKTSHNVTGLIGVMNGTRGDLRTGLVWQMVEYHDPLRIMFIIESTSLVLKGIMEKNQQVKQMIENMWVYTALVNPEDKTDIKLFKDGDFKSISIKEFNTLRVKNSKSISSSLFHPIHAAFIERRINE